MFASVRSTLAVFEPCASMALNLEKYMGLLKLSSWVSRLSIHQILRNGAKPDINMQADALEEYASHILNKKITDDDPLDSNENFIAKNGIHIYNDRLRTKRRTLIVAVDADVPAAKQFNPMAVYALRAYADAIESGLIGGENHEKFNVDNGCTVMSIAGANTLRTHADEN